MTKKYIPRPIYLKKIAPFITEENKKREFGNLLAIKDNYPKIVVSMDEVKGDEESYQGIRHLNIRYFLTHWQ